MYALVESESITKIFSYPKGFSLGDIQYSKDIFTKWSVEEKEAIGIYEIVFDDTNKKDEQWYINTNQSFTFANDRGLFFPCFLAWSSLFPESIKDLCVASIAAVMFTHQAHPGLRWLARFLPKHLPHPIVKPKL